MCSPRAIVAAATAGSVASQMSDNATGRQEPPEKLRSPAERAKYQADPAFARQRDAEFAAEWRAYEQRTMEAKAGARAAEQKEAARADAYTFLERKPDGGVVLFDPKWIGRNKTGAQDAPTFPKPSSDAIKALKRGEGTPQQFDEVFGPGAAAKALGR